MKEASQMIKKRDLENIFSLMETISSGVLRPIWCMDKAHFSVKEKKPKADGNSINSVDSNLFVLNFEFKLY
jgi:hypothetical protein